MSVPNFPTFPGRMVNTNSRVAAALRHLGWKATDVPPGPDGGPWVTMEEVEAEAARRGVPITLPEPLPPLEEPKARGFVRTMHQWGAHLMRLSEGSKRPVELAWQESPALTEDEAVDWLMRGNNIGINLRESGSNGWIVLDAENKAATDFLIAAGFFPTALTANAQDTTSEKYGGCHVWLPIPDDVDVSQLKSTLQINLPNGGVIDVLVGTRYAVAPGTRLDSAPGVRYTFSGAGAAADPSKWVFAPRWLFDRDAEAPDVPGIEALHGIARSVPRVRRATSNRADSDELTRRIDEIPTATWLGGDPRVQILGNDGSCDCPVFHWAGASTQRSGILHEGCEHGYGVHIFSGTLISQCGRDHMSKLDFAAWLAGRSDDLVAFAAGFGIKMGGGASVGGLTAHDIEALSRHRAAQPELKVITGGDEATGEPAPANLSSVPTVGSVAGDTPIEGATALNPEPAESASTVEAESEPDPEPEERDTGKELFRKIKEIDDTGFWESTPFLRKLARAADSNGVGRWGLLGATLPRVACTVPPEVRLVGASGKEGGPKSGASINLNAILTGAPEDGKSETIKLSQDLIALPPHTSEITTGTGEGIIKSFAYMKKSSDKGGDDAPPDFVPEPVAPEGDPADGSTAEIPVIGSVVGGSRFAKNNGYERVEITDTVMLTAAEISGMVAEMHRQGTKATSVFRSAWVGEELGMTTGEIERRTYLPPHSYRFGSVLGGQIDIDALGAIFNEGKLGSPQRFLFLPVMTVQAVGDPVRTINLPFIDWYDGQAPAAAVAGMVGARPPIFIKRPDAAHEEIEANRLARRARKHLAYSVAEVRRRAEDDDDLDEIGGHELLHQLKLAAVLAVGDGLRNPTDAHWRAAGVIMQVRELMVEVLRKVVVVQREIADRRHGKSQGRKQAAAKLAEREAKQEHLVEVTTRIMAFVTEKGAPMSEAEITRLLGKTAALSMSDALSELVDNELLFLVDRNNRGRGLFWIERTYP